MTYRDISNINKVPQPQRDTIKRLVEQADYTFGSSGVGSMIHSFFYDCVSGQIVRSIMPREAKKRYHNKLSDFYIDSRVSFRGRREIDNIINSDISSVPAWQRGFTSLLRNSRRQKACRCSRTWSNNGRRRVYF